MQVRGHYVAVGLAFVVLDAFMYPAPIVLMDPPQPVQGGPNVKQPHRRGHAASEGIDCRQPTDLLGQSAYARAMPDAMNGEVENASARQCESGRDRLNLSIL
jgi:hypothetical protein